MQNDLELAPKVGHDLLWIGKRAVRRRAHLRTSSDRPPDAIIPWIARATSCSRPARSVLHWRMTCQSAPKRDPESAFN